MVFYFMRGLLSTFSPTLPARASSHSPLEAACLGEAAVERSLQMPAGEVWGFPDFP